MKIRLSSLTLAAALLLAALCGHPARAQKGGTTPSYTFTDLGGLPGLSYRGMPYTNSQAYAINAAGQIVGTSQTAGSNGGIGHVVIWTKDATGKYGITDLGPSQGPNPPVACYGYALGINSQGEVVGGASSAGVPQFPFLIRPATDTLGNKVWYRDANADGLNDLMVNLGGQSGQDAHGINDATQIAAGNVLIQFNSADAEIVSTLPNGGSAVAINGSGQVAGAQGGRAALWTLDTAGSIGAMTPLSTLAGYDTSSASCISPLGRAAGASIIAALGDRPRATLWRDSTSPTDVGTLGGQESEAHGINEVGGALQIVGYSARKSNVGGYYAYVWKDGTITDLTSLLNLNGIEFAVAQAVNATGQIVGYARVKTKVMTEAHAFLLTPR